MNSNELKNIIENARIAKGISQRELAKLSGISRSTLNDIINGKIKRVDVDSLKKIAETLDLSLTNLLKVAGYDEFLDYLSLDKYKVSWLLESRRYTPSSSFAIQTFCFLSSIINPVDVMGISIF